MKWYTHRADLRQDEQVAEYLDLCSDRMVGYGFFHALLEVVSPSITKEHPRAVATYPSRTWHQLCGVHANRWRVHIELLVDCGLVLRELEKGKERVEIPKLLFWADNYIKKSVVAANKVPLDVDATADTTSKADADAERRGKRRDPIAEAAAAVKSVSSFSNGSDLSIGDKVDIELAKEAASVYYRNGYCNDQMLALKICGPGYNGNQLRGVGQCRRTFEQRRPDIVHQHKVSGQAAGAA